MEEIVLPPAPGVFKRLQVASRMLSIVHPTYYRHFAEFLREQVKLIESLQYYVMDMKSELLLKHVSSVPDGEIVSFQCIDSTMHSSPWVAVQLAFAIVAGHKTCFYLSNNLCTYFQDVIEKTDICPSIRDAIVLCNACCIAEEVPCAAATSYCCDPSNPYKFNESKDCIIFPSIFPSLPSFLLRDIQTVQYLTVRYGIDELMDEFDLLTDMERAQLVAEREAYLLSELKICSPFYSKIASERLDDIPIINGQTLSSNVPPYGTEMLSPFDHYTVAFATGGTTGRMKFVYRNDWEDKENARYLAKGLYSQGIREGDVVLNCLSGGFWGGSHVFSLALSYIGCSVIPLGMEFSSQDCVTFIGQLKPTAMIALPSFIVTLAEYVASRNLVDAAGLNGSLTKCITGGEMMLPAMEAKIRRVLGISQFLSTGYTSNETGAIAFRCRYLPVNYFHIHENMQSVSIDAMEEAHSYKDQNGGSVGRIITSNLNRTFMPVIRYDIGDSGRIVEHDTPDSSMAILLAPTNENMAAVIPSGGERFRCRCGRRLQIMELCGRWDNRIRLGGEDLYLSEIDNVIGQIPNLAPIYTLHIDISERAFDKIEIHVECPEDIFRKTQEDDFFNAQVQNQIAIHMGICSSLVWKPWLPISAAIVTGGESEQEIQLNNTYNKRMAGKAAKALAFLDGAPTAVFYLPGKLPRNSRTGKIAKIVDHRIEK